jgi:uncharacterized membrane protein YfcA
MNLLDVFFGIISGITASMGLGGGAVLIMYLTAFAGIEQQKSQGINLIFFIPVALVSICFYAYNKLINWKIIAQTAPTGLLGAVFGYFLLKHLNTFILSKIFGSLILVLGIYLVFKKNASKE